MISSRTSLVAFAVSLAGIFASGCSSPEPSSDSIESASADLSKTPAPAPTLPGPIPTPTVTAPPPPVSPPGTCSSGAFGNAKGLCSTDASMLASAEADCGEAKQLITTFSPDEACGAGSSNSATYTCCAKAVTPPPPPPACTGGGFANGGGACSSDTSMKASATTACESEGQVLTTFTPDEKCGKGESNSATYTCCPGVKPL